MKKILMLGAALLTLQALPALAQDDEGAPPPPPATEDGKPAGGPEGKPHRERFFEKQDANKDGKISKDEAIAGAVERFEKLDANKDGFVTKEEAKAAHDKMREEYRAKRGERKEGKDKADAPKAE